MRIAPGALVGALLLSGSLSGCTPSEDDEPDPRVAAEQVANALAEGDMGQAPWTDQTTAAAAADYARIVEGMGDLAPSVEVADLSEQQTSSSDEHAASTEATLTWTWPLGAQEWSYTSRLPLVLVDDTWKADWDPSVVEPSLTGRERLDVTAIAARRGDITGAHGTRVVSDRPVVRFGIDRTQVPAARAGESARQLAALLGIRPAAYAKQVEAAGDKAFVEALVLRKEAVPHSVARGYGDIRGARAIRGQLPLAPTADFAAPILGRVGPVTAEMIEKDPDRYQVGDVVGLSGLQARYDEQLAGTSGVVVNAAAPDGTERELFREPPVAGTPLRTTLDVGLQQSAERLLSDVGPASALVAIRPSTGNVVVAANGPGNGGVNVATYGQAAPGSTFKTVSSLALLRSGLTPESPVPCTGSVTVDGKVFTNYSDYPAGGLGRIPLRTAVANSCNTAFISQAPRLGRGDLSGAAATLGFGIDHDLGFPAYFGQVPNAGSETEGAAEMIGQGTVLASPLTMATVIASVQAGNTVVPRMIPSVGGAATAVPDAASPLTAAEERQLRAMLRGVVTSGSGVLLADVPGPPVIAKTGTAEFDLDGRVETHAWMIAAQGDLAVAVYVDRGDSGSGTAGPILEAFLRAVR